MQADQAVTGRAAGVPYVAVPPTSKPTASTPIVLAWHLQDPPRTESAFAAALPLAGLDAWRIYLGLPLSGSRMPAGGFEELMRLGYEDAVLNLQGPVATQAARECGPALAELRTRLGLGDGPVGLLGGSMGAAVAQLVLCEGSLPARAAVLVSPLVTLRPVVDALSKVFGVEYTWSPAADEVARRLDFVARADEIAHPQHKHQHQQEQPAVLCVVGADDDEEAIRQPAAALTDRLAGSYDDAARAQLAVVPDMAHALAEEPGIEPAPQTPQARAVDRLASTWLARHLAVD